MNNNASYNNLRQYNTNNYIKSSSSRFSISGVFGIVLLVIVIIGVLLASYWAYNVYSNKSFEQTVTINVMKDVKDANSKFAISSGSIPSSKYSNEYSISMWINIQDYTYNYGKEKIILRRGDASSPNIEIALGATENDLIVKLKLQGASPNSSSFIIDSNSGNTKSQFQDINTVYNINEKIDTGYIHGNFNLQNTTTNLVNCNNKVFNKISGNDINYETVKNNNNNNNDNNDNNDFLQIYNCQTGNNSNLDNMTIMNEQSKWMKEGLTCKYDYDYRSEINDAVASLDKLCTLYKPNYKSNIYKVSDNSSPIESQHFNNEYFKLVSGNEVSSCPKLHVENFNSKNKFNGLDLNIQNTNIEHFNNSTDFANMIATILLDVCDITTYLQSQDNADNSINNISKIFDILFTMINNNDSDLSNDKLINKILPIIDVQLKDLVNKLISDVKLIDTMPDSNQSELDNPEKFNAFKQIINNKLSVSKCPTLLINGDTMPNAAKNIGINMLTLIKTTIYTHISNMGNTIQRENPELINAQPNIRCITDISRNKDPTIGTCNYKMIPLQKWVHVIVSVYNQAIDIYIDGQLGSSCVLKGYPAVSTLDINLTPDGGFSGQISNVSFSNTAMTVTKSQELYYAGPILTDSIFTMISNWAYYIVIILSFLSIIFASFVM